jgi:glycogen synthase
MRVLMTTDTVGGVWTYALELVDALAVDGVDTTLLALGPRLDDGRRRAASRCAALEVHELPVALEWMDDPWHDVDRAGDRIAELVAAVRPDVLHLNDFSHGARAWPVPSVVVAHSCVLSWWEAVHGVAAPASWDRYRERVSAGVRGADAVVAPTRWMLEQVRTQHGAPCGSVVPNGRRDAWATPTWKEPIVLAAGRVWDEAKNIAALAAVADEVPWPIVVAGSAVPPRAEVGAMPPGLQLFGQLPTHVIERWFARAAVFAMPARYEPFGLAALEAGLARCALVLGDVPSLREVWGDAAVFVPPDDHARLAAVLRDLVADPGRCTELGARARERALGYPPERMAAGYRAVYADVVARRT